MYALVGRRESEVPDRVAHRGGRIYGTMATLLTALDTITFPWPTMLKRSSKDMDCESQS